jgi:alkane 1-monooxygenase
MEHLHALWISCNQMQAAAPRTRHDPALESVAWHDPKRFAWLLGLFIPFLPLVAWRLAERTDFGAFWFYGPVVVYGLFPIVDWLVGRTTNGPPDAAIKWLEQDRFYRWCTYLFLPLQYAGLVLACWLWSEGGLTTLESIGLAVTVGVVAGDAINIAHELGHKRDDVERWLSRIALAQSGYGQFHIEHNRGHHVRVATPEDPASARLGEGFWSFLPRTVVGSLQSAWSLERARLERTGHSPWSPRNDILQAWAMSLVLFAGLIAVFGVGILPFLVLQAIVGVTLLEVINYIEHYGLLRRKRNDGTYERCLPEHSWNSDNLASNIFLYHLQRHSDHHTNPTRRFQALRHIDHSPQLPTGYPGMMALAFVPPLWRRVMDRRVLDYYNGDVTRANLQPRHRARILGT